MLLCCAQTMITLHNIRSAVNFSRLRLVRLSCLCLNWGESLENNGRQFPLKSVVIYHVRSYVGNLTARQSLLSCEVKYAGMIEGWSSNLLRFMLIVHTRDTDLSHTDMFIATSHSM